MQYDNPVALISFDHPKSYGIQRHFKTDDAPVLIGSVGRWLGT